MKVVREICVSGNVIDVVVKVTSGNHTGKREPRKEITREAVKKNNDRMAAKKLRRIFNANCDHTWYHDTLTHKEEPTFEESIKIMKNFISRLRNRMKKAGMELKWISACEKRNRIHHHFITNAPLEMVREAWQQGHVLPRPLDKGPDYIKLAEYIIKETSTDLRENDFMGSRYSHSRNLIIPEVKVEEVSPRMLILDPKPFMGYFIDQDSIRRYAHPITELEHLEYTMISNDADPRIKRYYKGKKKKKETSYTKFINYNEKQESIFGMFDDAWL